MGIAGSCGVAASIFNAAQTAFPLVRSHVRQICITVYLHVLRTIVDVEVCRLAHLPQDRSSDERSALKQPTKGRTRDALPLSMSTGSRSARTNRRAPVDTNALARLWTTTHPRLGQSQRPIALVRIEFDSLRRYQARRDPPWKSGS